MKKIMRLVCLIGSFVLILTTTFSIVYAQGTVNLPQTDQTKCYDQSGVEINCLGTGQDGENRAGVEWPDPRFTIDGDCVIDNLTGLMRAKNGYLPNGPLSWQGGLDYIASLNSSGGLCGYADWRLPNIIELESLIYLGERDPTSELIYVWLKNQGFIGVEPNYWSSTTGNQDMLFSWCVEFGFGSVYYRDKSDFTYVFVWPVRSGQLNNPHIPHKFLENRADDKLCKQG